MSGLSLSPRERIMFNTLKKNPETTIEDIAKALRKRGEKPKGGTRSLTVSVRYLGYKLAPQGLYIERISGLGRGNTARYQLRRHDDERRPVRSRKNHR